LISDLKKILGFRGNLILKKLDKIKLAGSRGWHSEPGISRLICLIFFLGKPRMSAEFLISEIEHLSNAVPVRVGVEVRNRTPIPNGERLKLDVRSEADDTTNIDIPFFGPTRGPVFLAMYNSAPPMSMINS